MFKGDRRILVADDDWTIWSSYEHILSPEKKDSDSPLEQLKTVLQPADVNSQHTSHTFNLSFASQGQEALRLAEGALKENKPFNLAFIDVRMPPGLDGMETARRIRQMDSDIEIVIVTAFSDRSSAEITEVVGSPHKLLFFRKPFDPDELKQLAISLTDKYHLTLKETNQRRKLEALLESSPTAIFTADSDFKLLTWNRAAEAITGYRADDVLGKPMDIETLPKNSNIFHSCFSELNENGVQDRQFSICCKDKSCKTISLNLAKIFGRTSKDQRFIGSFWDITELRNSQTALSKTNEELKKQMKEKDRLQQKQLRLERKFNQARKMEAIGLMAGGVAHDLNNILTSIVSYPDLMLIGLEKDSKLYQGISMIQKSGKRAAAVVADLLTVARGVAVEKQVASLNSLIIEYLESPEGQMLKERYPKVVIRSDLTPLSSAIYCSPVHITKCIMNLLHNAAEALTRSWNIEIKTEIKSLDEERGEELDLTKGAYVLLTVRDHGTGISREDQERIFEPFFSRKVVGQSGTGLGLTVVWNTVLDHNGAIQVESGSYGTTFRLYFPLSKEKPLEPGKAEKLADLQGKGSVLVVDDEEQQRIVLTEILQTLGYSIQSVNSGEEAIAYLKKEKVDLVLLDMIMEPGIDGLQTYKKILKLNPKQRAVIISGFSENEIVQQARDLGVGDFISKPFSIEQIGLTVKKIIG